MNARILIVDDEPDVCYVLKETLDYEGFDVTALQDGDEAIRLMNETPFDVIIVDLRLEGQVSGLDIIRQWKEKRTRPILIVSSGTPKAMLEDLFAQENVSHLIDMTLEKPADLNPELFGKKVRIALEKRK